MLFIYAIMFIRLAAAYDPGEHCRAATLSGKVVFQNLVLINWNDQYRIPVVW